MGWAPSFTARLIKPYINIALALALPDHLWTGVQSSMYLFDRTILEPDLVVYPRGIELEAEGRRHHPGHRDGADDARL